MSNRLFLILLLLLSLIGAVSFSSFSGPNPESDLSRLQIESDLRFLASDELAGRKIGTPGADTAARFIAESFRAAGLDAFPTLPDYLQIIPFQRITPPSRLQLTLDHETFGGSQLAWLAGGGGEIEGDALFFESWTDALVGKIWLTSLSLEGGTARLQEELDSKWQQGIRNGARAVIHVYSETTGWNRLAGFLSRPRIEVANREATIPHLMLAGAPDLSKQTLTFHLVYDGPQIEEFTSSNVVGMIKGSAPDVRDHYVLLVAHYDHLGKSEEPADNPGEDVIFNGARDNGMGVAALLGAARSLSRQPPRRSVILLAVTGEEEGLLGSRHFVDNSIVPLEKITFALNADGAGFTDTDVITIIGLDRTTSRDLFRRAGAELGIEAIAELAEAASFYTRSDNYNFARKGVPSVTFSPGFRQMNQDLMRYYHKTSDEADEHFDFPYLVKFVRVFARAARHLADTDQFLGWTDGDPFEPAGRALYGLP